MTTPDLAGLCERLKRRLFSRPGESMVNPDGPEAAAAIESLVAALEPLAEIANQYDDAEDDEWEVWRDGPVIPAMRSNLELRHFRRARTALEGASDDR